MLLSIDVTSRGHQVGARELDHHDDHNCFLKMIRMVTKVPSRVSNDVTLSLNTARQHGIEKCVEKMLNFADQLRRLKVALEMILMMLMVMMMMMMTVIVLLMLMMLMSKLSSDLPLNTPGGPLRVCQHESDCSAHVR